MVAASTPAATFPTRRLDSPSHDGHQEPDAVAAPVPSSPAVSAQLTAADSSASLPRVVVVDKSPETREVLHTLLETRGVDSIEVRSAREGLELIRQHRPEVVVLDLDAESADDESLRDALDNETRAHDTALVILGKARRYVDNLPPGQVLPKPYHYAPLIRTIERLLGR